MSAPTPEQPTATLRIVQEYDGAFHVAMPNGDQLPGVRRVAVYLDADTGQAEAHITVTGVALDVLLPTYARPAPPRPLPGPPAGTSRATPAQRIVMTTVTCPVCAAGASHDVTPGDVPPGHPDLYQSLQAVDEESR